MSTLSLLPEYVEALAEQERIAAAAAIPTPTKLYIARREDGSMDESHPVCILCGEPAESRPSDEGVYTCGSKCWFDYMKVPEVKAVHDAQEAAYKAEDEKRAAWELKGRMLGGLRKSLIGRFSQLQFSVGDWLVEEGGCSEDLTDRFLMNRLSVASKLTGYSVSSLRKFAAITRRVPAGIRIPELPWAAHQAVAYLKDPEQRKSVLQEAAAKKLPIAEIRKLVKELPKEPVELKGRARFIDESMKNLYDWLTAPPKVDETRISFYSLADRTNMAARLKKTAALLNRYAELLAAAEPAHDTSQQAGVTA